MEKRHPLLLTLPLQAGWRKVEPCPWRGHKVDDVQDDVRVSGEEKLTGENTCLGSGLGSVEHFGGWGAQAAFIHLSTQSAQVSETGLGGNLSGSCFYTSCQGCVYTLGCGLSVWGHSRAQGLWGLCQRSRVLGTINIYARAWGWILVRSVLSLVSSLFFGGKCLYHSRRNQSGHIQIKGSKPRKEAGRYPSWQCKSTPKIAHIEEIQQKDHVKKFPWTILWLEKSI